MQVEVKVEVVLMVEGEAKAEKLCTWVLRLLIAFAVAGCVTHGNN
jgi:hypothetical protein